MSRLQLLFIRHAESQGNRVGRMEGWQSTALTTVGWQQAIALGQQLSQEPQPTHLYSSPLQRSVQTVAGLVWGYLHPTAAPRVPPDLQITPETTQLQLTQTPDAEPVTIPLIWSAALKEYQNGIFAGLTWAEAQQRYPQLCQQLETTADWLPIPGAETLSEGRNRAQQFIHHLLNTRRNGDRVWIVSHHWMLQQLVAGVMGCDRTWGFAIPHTARFEFWLDADRGADLGENRWNSELWQIRRFNDCQHWAASL